MNFLILVLIIMFIAIAPRVHVAKMCRHGTIEVDAQPRAWHPVTVKLGRRVGPPAILDLPRLRIASFLMFTIVESLGMIVLLPLDLALTWRHRRGFVARSADGRVVCRLTMAAFNRKLRAAASGADEVKRPWRIEDIKRASTTPNSRFVFQLHSDDGTSSLVSLDAADAGLVASHFRVETFEQVDGESILVRSDITSARAALHAFMAELRSS